MKWTWQHHKDSSGYDWWKVSVGAGEYVVHSFNSEFAMVYTNVLGGYSDTNTTRLGYANSAVSAMEQCERYDEAVAHMDAKTDVPK